MAGGLTEPRGEASKVLFEATEQLRINIGACATTIIEANTGVAAKRAEIAKLNGGIAMLEQMRQVTISAADEARATALETAQLVAAEGAPYSMLLPLYVLAGDRDYQNNGPDRAKAVEAEVNALEAIEAGQPVVILRRGPQEPIVGTTESGIYGNQDQFSVKVAVAGASTVAFGGKFASFVTRVKNGAGYTYVAEHGIYAGLDRIKQAATADISEHLQFAGPFWVVALNKLGLTIEDLGLDKLLTDAAKQVVKNNVKDPKQNNRLLIVRSVEAAFLLGGAKKAASARSTKAAIVDGLCREWPRADDATRAALRSTLKTKVEAWLICKTGKAPTEAAITGEVEAIIAHASVTAKSTLPRH